jgi:sulfide:quinone oxidoreductase
MDIKQLDERLSVSAQPGIDDIEQLAKQGFRTIISTRPRCETEDQPDTHVLKKKAESLGMTWHEIPVEPGKYASTDIDAFAKALQSSPAPILGYCRTGKRATHLWAYSQAQVRPIPELLSSASSAGYDLKALQDDLLRYQSRANNG